MLSNQRFLTFSLKQQHKLLSEFLSQVQQGKLDLYYYNNFAKTINLEPISLDIHLMQERFYQHSLKACISFDETKWPHKQTDSLSNEKFLPIDIYLSKLRSAHNVGSIIRTTEAFRLGSIHACPDTPLVNHPKVKKTSMGTSSVVSLYQKTPFEKLKRPFIALETEKNSHSIFTYSFPSSFTLFLGNEHVGLDPKILDLCDTCIKIPLVGQKNSLNVANAFAISAGLIRSQNDENKN